MLIEAPVEPKTFKVYKNVKDNIIKNKRDNATFDTNDNIIM